MAQCVIAFETYSAKVCHLVAAAGIEWDYVIDLGAGCAVANGANGLFA